jgi:hypothetical protein
MIDQSFHPQQPAAIASPKLWAEQKFFSLLRLAVSVERFAALLPSASFPAPSASSAMQKRG